MTVQQRMTSNLLGQQPLTETKISKGFFFKSIFSLSYFLMMLASVKYIKDDSLYIDNVNILRVALISIGGALWIGRATIDRSLPVSVLFIGIVFSAYGLTDAAIAFVDLVTLIIFASALNKSYKPEQYFVLLAYWSLAFVCLVTVLAIFGLLPSAVFEWEGRSKNSYGFTNPNVLFFYIFSSALTFFACKERNGLIICGIIMAVLYSAVGSRTFGFAYILIASSYFLLLKIDHWLIRVLLWIAIIATALTGLLTVYFPLEFARWTSEMLGVDSDALVSNRFTIMESMYIDSGDYEFWLGGLENLSDSMYSYFTRSFGVAISLALLFLALKNLKEASNLAGSVPLVFLLTFFVVGLVEVPFDGTSLVSLIFVYSIFYDREIFVRWRESEATPKNTVGKRRWW